MRFKKIMKWTKSNNPFRFKLPRKPFSFFQVDYATWFGGNVEFIHCIQMLPFTPITEELLRKEWVEEEYPVVAEAYNRGDLSEEWKVF